MRSSRSLSILDEIRHAPEASTSEIRSRQFQSLSGLLHHAEARVPYYREMFHNLSISARDIRSFEDFNKLPILTKKTVRERQRDLLREDVSLEDLEKRHSGGSTGIPLTFYSDKKSSDAGNAGTYRNLLQSGWRPGEMIAFFWGWDEKLKEMGRLEFEVRQRVRRSYQFNPFNSGAGQMEHWLHSWRKIKPRVALGYASSIARFAEFLEETGESVEPLKGVYTTAEKLYPAQRDVLARVFSCQVYDLYGSSEVQNIAAECSAGSMHVNADFVVVETESTSDLPSGPRPLLVTSLWNYAMPFIRYRNEDVGELLDGTCGCGNNFPLMRLNISRISDNFELPDGRVVHGEFFTHLMYGSDGIGSFQFHQHARDRITLKIVPDGTSGVARERSVRSALDEIEAVSDGTVEVKVVEVDSIPKSSAGKHRFTRSDITGERQ